MSAIILDTKREELLRKISNVLQKWPDLDRRIFARAHYKGQSPESISHSLDLDVEKVSTILRQCDRDLHTSLRGFWENGCDNAALPPIPPAGVSVRDL